jgi:hypothetical protein
MTKWIKVSRDKYYKAIESEPVYYTRHEKKPYPIILWSKWWDEPFAKVVRGNPFKRLGRIRRQYSYYISSGFLE